MFSPSTSRQKVVDEAAPAGEPADGGDTFCGLKGFHNGGYCEEDGAAELADLHGSGKDAPGDDRLQRCGGGPTTEPSSSDRSAAPSAFSVEKIQLKRSVGLCSAVAIIGGTIVGSGIFFTPQLVLSSCSGSIGVSLLVWLLAGLLSGLAALCYIELGLLMPRAGGEFTYLLESFGGLHDFWGPLPAFLFGWISVLVVRPGGMAIMSLVFAEHCLLPFYSGCDAMPPLVITSVASAAALLATATNIYSLQLATRVQNLFTGTKLLAICPIVMYGLYWIFSGHTDNLSRPFEAQGQRTSAAGLTTAFFAALWTFDGWNTLNYLTEELEDPRTVMPRAVGLSMALVTGLYLLINISFFSVLPMRQLEGSETLVVLFARASFGPLAFLAPLAVAVCVYGSMNGSSMADARISFAAARAGHFLQVFGLVHVEWLTPLPSLLLNGFSTLALIQVGSINRLVDGVGVAIWIYYGGAICALLVLRSTRPHDVRHFRVWTPVAWLVLLVSLVLVVTPVVRSPQLEHLYVFLCLTAGLAVYVPFIHCGWSPRWMVDFTTMCQKLLQVVATDVD